MPGKVKHVKELLEMFNALTEDKRFIDMYTHRKGEQNDMTALALDFISEEFKAKAEKKARAAMRAEGEKSGRASAREEIALAMFADHVPVDKIAKYSKLTLKKATALGKKHGYI